MSSTDARGTNPAPTLYVDQRPATPNAVPSLRNTGFPARFLFAPLRDLDRRTAKSWISLIALAVFLALSAACSGVEEDTGSNRSEIAVAGRWRPSAAALTAGAKVRLDYDEAPKWTTTAACGRGLKAGGQKLGTYLRDKFTVITSVGGFACRKNTADASRMSVHGTGRALDIFVPKTGGAADNGQGDKVANWLIANAQRIGVQLIIWDRSIWRANGTNDAAYGGPHPHDDHLHVELTTEGGDAKTAWFLDMSDGTDAGAPATNDDDAGTTTDTETDDDDAGNTTTPPAQDSGTVDANKDAGSPSQPDSAPPPSTPSDPSDPSDEPAPETPSTSEPRGDSLPDEPSDTSDGLESADDEPGETDSLQDEPRSKRKSSSTLEDAPMPNAGCSASPSSSPASSSGVAFLAVAITLTALRRRKSPAR